MTFNKAPLITGGAFLVGLSIGGIAGYKFMERKAEAWFQEELEKETEALRAYFGGVHKPDFPTPQEAVEKLVVGTEEITEVLTAYQGREGDKQKVPYHKIAKSTVVSDNVEVERPIANDEKLIPQDPDEFLLEIQVISKDEFDANESDFIQNTLTYYELDKVLTDHRDDVIEEPDNVIGTTALDSFGKYCDDPNMVHVRNGVLNMEYEIVKSPGSYNHEVLGEEHPNAQAAKRGG